MGSVTNARRPPQPHGVTAVSTDGYNTRQQVRELRRQARSHDEQAAIMRARADRLEAEYNNNNKGDQ